MSINCLSPSLELPPAVYSSLLPLTRPLLHPPLCVLGVLGSSMPFPAHSDCVLRDEFSHLFITNSLVFLPKLGNVSTAWLHSWRSMPPKNATNIYLPASLSTLWWYLTPCFSSKSWQWVIKYLFLWQLFLRSAMLFYAAETQSSGNSWGQSWVQLAGSQGFSHVGMVCPLGVKNLLLATHVELKAEFFCLCPVYSGVKTPSFSCYSGSFEINCYAFAFKKDYAVQKTLTNFYSTTAWWLSMFVASYP